MNVLLVRRPADDPPGTTERVSVCIPARDEAARIGPCVRSVLASRGVPDLDVVVVDDGSTDGTADVVRAAARGDGRVRVVIGGALPDGWLGKPHACAQAAAAATGAVLVFLDADVVVRPHAVAAAVDLLRRHRLDLVSPYPRQLAVTPAERLVQPLLQWSWLTFLPLRLAERPRPESMAAANGQFLVCDAAAYRRAGGHASVRDHVIEDVWLARAVKRAGGRAVVADGTRLATCRMYGGWADVRDGYSKSLWAAFGSPAGAAGMAALLSLLYLVPPVAALGGVVRRLRGRPAGRSAVVGAAGSLAAVAGRTVAARATGGRPADAVAHPASVAVLLGLLARSVRLRRRGALTWKGRTVGG